MVLSSDWPSLVIPIDRDWLGSGRLPDPTSQCIASDLSKFHPISLKGSCVNSFLEYFEMVEADVELEILIDTV